MNVENILKVADRIERAAKKRARPRVGFNMAAFLSSSGAYEDQTGHHCRTTACIGGWVFLQHGLEYGPDGSSHKAAELLGIKDQQRRQLFFMDDDTSGIHITDVTPAHAVAVLRHLAAAGVVDWKVGAPSADADTDPSPIGLEDDAEALASAGMVEEQ